MSVTGAQGGQACLVACLAAGFVDAEAEAGDFVGGGGGRRRRNRKGGG